MSQATAALPAGSEGLARPRVSRLFGDVRPGEGAAVLLMAGNLLLLLVGYYVVKVVREPLILATGGAELKSYAAAVQALALMAFVPAYGWLASKVDRLRLITWIVLFFVACLELFNLGLRLELRNVGFVFYVWVGIFSLATIAQFWSFANDLYRRDVGERLFPLIAIGANVGSPLGAKLAGWLFDSGTKPANMLHVTVVILLVHLVLYRLVQQRGSAGRAAVDEKAPITGPGGFRLVFSSRYLLCFASLIILLNVVNTVGEYIIGRSVVNAADAAHAADAGVAKAAFIGSFYADYFFWVNVVAIVLQAFLASRLVRRFGLAGVLLALPLVSLSSYALTALGASFVLVRWAKTAENATDYSIMNTARQMVWLPTRREEKYKAKQAIDTFFMRFGDVAAAGVVFAGTSWLGWGIRGFASANVLMVVLWFFVAALVLRQNRKLIEPREVQ
jgi:AAA family ATP:ADP antiporter